MFNSSRTLFFLVLSFSFISCSNSDDIQKTGTPSTPKPDPIIKIKIPSTNTVGTLLHESDVFDGYTLFTPSKSTQTYLIDNCGQLINKWTSTYKSGKSVYLLKNGNLLRAGEILNPNIKIGGIGGIIELFDWDGNIIWSYRLSNEQASHHHDAIALPNGNLLLLVAQRKTKEQAIAAGREPENIDEELYTEKIIEIKPIGNNEIEIIWQWDVWDHLIQDYDNSKENYGIVNSNPQLLDINFTGRSGNKADWLHANSIHYNNILDQILISFQGTSEIFIIDHSTTLSQSNGHSGGIRNKGGDILYRWGNPASYKLGKIENQTLFGQHYPHWIPSSYKDGGKILIFNNGLERYMAGDFSTVNIINPEQNGQGNYIFNLGSPYAPTTPEWEYKDENNFFSEIISSAQRLQNGNTLICEGTTGRFFEIDTNKTKVWEYINPDSVDGIAAQGEEITNNAVFRVLKYSKDYPAFKNKNLTPKKPIELDFNIGNCK